MRRFSRFWISLGLTIAAVSPVQAQKGRIVTLSVSVTEDASGRPLPGARVMLSGVAEAAITDARGLAEIRGIVPGQHLLSISRPGFAAEKLALVVSDQDVEAEIAMLAQAVELDGVTGTSWGRSRILRDNGFYTRQRMGLGSFLEREDIERMHPLLTADLFRHMRGFRVSLDEHGHPIVVGTHQGCIPDFYLDGMAISKRRDRFTFGPRTVTSSINPLDLVGTEQIEAIESFAGPASIPAQYNMTGSACGVILIWTRAGS